MTKDSSKHGDCTLVNCNTRFREFKRWGLNNKEPMPFYIQTGFSGGVVFTGTPEIVRQLMRTYNQQRLSFQIDLISFLNAEGIVAHKVAGRVDDVLGYHAEISNN